MYLKKVIINKYSLEASCMGDEVFWVICPLEALFYPYCHNFNIIIKNICYNYHLKGFYTVTPLLIDAECYTLLLMLESDY
jgi:hypothetical protein